MGNVARVFMVNQEMAALDSQSVRFWPRLGLQQMEIYLFIHFGQIIYHCYFFIISSICGLQRFFPNLIPHKSFQF